jgi:hypothetical protein
MRHTASAVGYLAALFFGHVLTAAEAPAAPEADPPPSLASSREMLELLRVADRLRAVSDDADFPPEGDDLLYRLLYAVRRFRLGDLDRWQQSELSVDALRKDAPRYRGDVVALTGTVTRVTRHDLPAEIAEQFDLARYYRCEMDLADSESRAVIYALAVPRQWLSAKKLHARSGVKGLFVRLTGDDPAAPVLVAKRVAWYPDTFLGDLDMDVGLFDELSNRPDWAGGDGECFYQLLAAVGRTGTQQLLRAVPDDGHNTKVEPLFNQPQTQHGRLVKLTGTARRAVRVLVDDRDIVARFGIDHYYEVDIFTEDSQANPLTFCVRELPKGFPNGAEISEPVRIAGFFLKKWGYRMSAVDADDKPGTIRRQLAPLLIGREPIWLETPVIDQRFANGVFLVLFVVLTVVLWIIVSRLNRSDAKFRKKIARHFTEPQEKSLNELGLDDESPPA